MLIAFVPGCIENDILSGPLKLFDPVNPTLKTRSKQHLWIDHILCSHLLNLDVSLTNKTKPFPCWIFRQALKYLTDAVLNDLIGVSSD